MFGFLTGVDDLIALARGLHFAACVTLTGALIFRELIAGPVLDHLPEARALSGRQARSLSWTGLSIALISGGAWLWLLAMSVSDQGFREVAGSGALREVLQSTQFGVVLQIRTALALLLAACLYFEMSIIARRLALVLAILLMISLAWTGHAGSSPGHLHLGSDVAHLAAASAWLGGLLPLALLLASLSRHADWKAAAIRIVRRFSTLGMVSVAVLILSGAIHAWILVGSFRALTETDYGEVLISKLVAFAVMLALAACNRLILTPRLVSPSGKAARALLRNTLIEAVLGLVILLLVGLLGTLHPAVHFLI